MERIYPYNYPKGGGVYLITPLIDVKYLKKYIGETRNFSKRLSIHLTDLGRYINIPMKYFAFYILEYCNDKNNTKEHRLEREEYWGKKLGIIKTLEEANADPNYNEYRKYLCYCNPQNDGSYCYKVGIHSKKSKTVK